MQDLYRWSNKGALCERAKNRLESIRMGDRNSSANNSQSGVALKGKWEHVLAVSSRVFSETPVTS